MAVFFRHYLLNLKWEATPDSSRAVVSYWRTDVHLVLVNHLGSVPRNSVVRLTDRLNMTIIVDWDIKPQFKQTNGNKPDRCTNILLSIFV